MAKAKPKPKPAPVRKPVPAKKTTTAVSGSPVWATFIKNNWIPMLLITAYAVVDFLPPFDSVDAMGAQWLYMVCVSIVTVAFILLSRHDNYVTGLNRVIKSVMSLMYIALFFLAGISIFFALNQVESFVVYGRVIATVVAYVNIAILLYNRPELVKFFCHVLALMLLVRSIAILVDFANGFGEIQLETLIYSQGKETGNKNIMAATFTVRLPFVLYCIYTSKPIAKIFYGITLVLGIIVVFLLNARTTYVAVLLQSFLYLVFIVALFIKESAPEMGQRLKTAGIRLAYHFVPLLIAFVIGQMILKNAVEMENRPVAYGTVTSRLASITPSGETSNNRVAFWSYALDYTKKHPLMGCGIGNWKLASIPYERDISYELWVAYHCHNDFLEISAELGILGGLLFLGLFVCALVYTIKTYMSNAEQNIKTLSVMSLIALAGYFTDAFFNFPNERPVMQFYFVIILAINLAMYMVSRNYPKPEKKTGIGIKSLYGLLTIGVLIPGLYVTYMTYKSMVIQSNVNPDISIEVPHFNSEEAKKLPPIPNLNVFAYPIDAIKARYLLNEKKYDEALKFLDKSIHVNPALSYNEFMKSATFVELNKMDSAYFYSKKSFNLKPGAKSNYLMLNFIAMKLGDTAMVRYALMEHHKRKPAAWVWENYLKTMMQLPRNTQNLLAAADTALKLYPEDSSNIMPLRNAIQNMGNTAPVQNMNTQRAAEANTKAKEGINAFGSKDYRTAITYFLKAFELNPGDYVNLENAGMSYYSLNDYKSAIVYYNKVIASKTINSGKSEFFKGICLVNLGKPAEGCTFLNLAQSKGYPDAKKYVDIYCKTPPTK